MSRETMSWRLDLDTRSERGASKVTRRVATELERPLDMQRMEPRWQDGGITVFAGVHLQASSLPDAVLEALTLAGRVAYQWTVSAPWETPGATWEFDGWAYENFRVAGLVSAVWALSRMPAPAAETSD